MEDGPLNYEQYLALQTRVDWLYDFHPEYFDQLEAPQRVALQKGLLYDTEDSNYPESIRQYYETSIETNNKLQQDIIRAVQTLYALSGSGELDLNDV